QHVEERVLASLEVDHARVYAHRLEVVEAHAGPPVEDLFALRRRRRRQDHHAAVAEVGAREREAVDLLRPRLELAGAHQLERLVAGHVRKFTGRISLSNRLPSSAATSRHASDRKSTRLNSSHQINSYAVFCLKK